MVTVHQSPDSLQRWEFPADLYYHPFDFVWARLEGEHDVRLGLSAFILWFATKNDPLQWMRTLPEGRVVHKEQALGSLESIAFFGALRSPVAGRIVELNSELIANPGRMHEDPYGSWIMRIRASNIPADLHDCPHGEQAIRGWMKLVLSKMEEVHALD